jgi:hypothetical protein
MKSCLSTNSSTISDLGEVDPIPHKNWFEVC